MSNMTLTTEEIIEVLSEHCSDYLGDGRGELTIEESLFGPDEEAPNPKPSLFRFDYIGTEDNDAV